ncbi:MAG: hypothetical protein N4A62_09985 [Marinisporobacter sp.]|jgi:hypothetical protein|nr:hypothetical protein [Marinisporobacter sp.]
MYKKMRNNYNRLKSGIIFMILGLVLVGFQYTFIYNINGNNVENYITQQIREETKKTFEININVIDKLNTEFGLIVLFKTTIEEKPIGYAVFEKDAILNRYSNEDFALYENKLDYNGDSDALIDLTSDNVFKFKNDKIELINSKHTNKRLIKYYVIKLVSCISIVYGLFIFLRVLIRKKN